MIRPSGARLEDDEFEKASAVGDAALNLQPASEVPGGASAATITGQDAAAFNRCNTTLMTDARFPTRPEPHEGLSYRRGQRGTVTTPAWQPPGRPIREGISRLGSVVLAGAGQPQRSSSLVINKPGLVPRAAPGSQSAQAPEEEGGTAGVARRQSPVSGAQRSRFAVRRRPSGCFDGGFSSSCVAAPWPRHQLDRRRGRDGSDAACSPCVADGAAAAGAKSKPGCRRCRGRRRRSPLRRHDAAGPPPRCLAAADDKVG